MLTHDQAAKWISSYFYTKDQLPPGQSNISIGQQAWPINATSSFYDPARLSAASIDLQNGNVMKAWLDMQGPLFEISVPEVEEELAAAQQAGQARDSSRVW